MTIGLLSERSKKTFVSRTVTRFAITFIILGMVLSSPIFMLSDSTQAWAADPNHANTVDSSGYHSTPSVPTVSASPLTSATPMIPATTNQGNDGDFTAQAALSLTRATQTDNLVNSKTYYDISFRTATAGIIKKVEMAFPVGTYVGSAVLIEAVGIGPGTIAASGTSATGMTLTYTVTNEVNVPALTRMRIQIANANNPPDPSNSLTVTITTRNSANNIIDGPTGTNDYNIKQIGTADIANGAITTTKFATGAVETTDIANGAVTAGKLSPTYTYTTVLRDDANGNSKGWDPNGVVEEFFYI